MDAALLAGALIALVPVGLTGDSSAGGAHDLATNGLSFTSSRAHCGRAACWHCWLTRCVRAEHADLAARRFSALALWCFVAMAASGVVNALVRIQLTELFRSEYGWLVIGKFAALCVLGLIGWRQRRGGLAALETDPEAQGR